MGHRWPECLQLHKALLWVRVAGVSPTVQDLTLIHSSQRASNAQGMGHSVSNCTCPYLRPVSPTVQGLTLGQCLQPHKTLGHSGHSLQLHKVLPWATVAGETPAATASWHLRRSLSIAYTDGPHWLASSCLQHTQRTCIS